MTRLARLLEYLIGPNIRAGSDDAGTLAWMRDQGYELERFP